MNSKSVDVWKLWEGSWRVSWKGLDLGRIHLRRNGRYQWMSMRRIRVGWGDTLREATKGLLQAELEDDDDL